MNSNACCYEGTGTDDPESNDCLEKWKEKLEDVSNEYSEKAAITSQHKEEYVNSLSWETKLKNWNEIIKKTDEKANDVVTQLEFFWEQAKIVCENAECTTEVLEKLLCLVKSIFDCFYTYDQSNEGLKEKIINFKKAVECLKTVSDEDKAEVIKCIETYEQKIILVCEMQSAILTKLMETLKCANLLYASICSEGGLKDKIESILEDFKGAPSDDDGDCESDDGDDEMPSRDEHRHHSDHHHKYPCNDKKAKRKPKFPIKNSRYYKTIKKEFERAEEKTKTLELTWKNSKKVSDKVLSHKTSLTEAIKAAEAAESAK